MSGARLRTPGNARALSAADDARVFSFIASKCAREPASARLRDALQGSCSAVVGLVSRSRVVGRTQKEQNKILECCTNRFDLCPE